QVSSTYGHSQLKTGHPVRSAIHKQLNGRLVLRWVTTWESLLLYVLCFRFALYRPCVSFDNRCLGYCSFAACWSCLLWELDVKASRDRWEAVSAFGKRNGC
ncbi:hypothetical protein M436DRAFT_44605, partial [Aureobasidium namibiae CBS 147.97]